MPIGGIRMSLTSDVTIPPKAVPDDHTDCKIERISLEDKLPEFLQHLR